MTSNGQVTIEDIYNQLQEILLLTTNISGKLQISGNQVVVIGGLSDISNSLGLIMAGEYRAGVGIPNDPSGLKKFTGVRIANPSLTYNNHQYSIVGVNQDTLKFGLSIEDGSIYAELGSIGGWNITSTQLNADNGNIVLDSSVPAIRLGSAAGYLNGTGMFFGKNSGIYRLHIGDPTNRYIGWDGSVLTVSGKIKASSLEADLFVKNAVSTFGGKMLLSQDEGLLTAGVTAAATSIPIDAGASGVTVGDVLWLKTATIEEFMVVTGGYSSGSITVTRGQNGTTGYAWPAGSVFVDIGQNGNGYIVLDALNTPRISMFLRGTGFSSTEYLRIGNLRDFLDTGANDYYGMGVGSGTNFIRFNPTQGFLIQAGTGSVNIDAAGITLSAEVISPIKWKYNDGDYGTIYLKSGGGLYLINYADHADIRDNRIGFIADSGYMFFGGVNTRTPPSDNQTSLVAFNGGSCDLVNTSTTVDQELVNMTAMTLVSSGAAKTLNNASTLRIWGAPVASTGITITNSYALYVSSGDSRFEKVFATSLYDPNGNSFPQLDGWQVSSETPYGASGSSLGHAYKSNLVNAYPPGTKIKFEQHGVTKYFYVLSTSWDATNIYINITAGSNFSVENSVTYPISNFQYSYAEHPQGFPHWFNWTPAWTGLTTPGAPIYNGTFCIAGQIVYYSWDINPNGTTTSSAGGGTTYINNLPVTVYNNWGYIGYVTWSSLTGGMCYTPNGTTYLQTPAWAATGNFIVGSGWYRMAS